MATYAAPWTSLHVSHLATLISITPVYPVGFGTLYFTDSVVIDNAFGTGLASVGQASVYVVSELEIGGTDRLVVAIRNAKVWQGNTENVYVNLAHLLSYVVIHGAGVTIRQYAEGDGTSDKRVITTSGRVENVTDMTATNVTLEINLDQERQRRVATRRTVGDAEWPYDQDDILDASKGLALPLRLGPPMFLPAPWTTEQIMYSALGSGHQRASLIPARTGGVLPESEYQIQNQDVFVAHAEKKTTLASYSIFDPLWGSPERLLKYIPGSESFAIYDGITNATESEATGDGYHWAKINSQLGYGYLLPTRYVGKIGGDGIVTVTDAAALTKRDLGSYCRIQSFTPNAKVAWNIPEAFGLGVINGTSPFAMDLYIYTTTSQGGVNATGQFQLGLSVEDGSFTFHAKAGTPQFYDSSYSGWRLIMAVGNVDYPDRRTVRGTNWQRLQFTCGGSPDANDPDYWTYHNDAVRGLPVNLTIRTGSTNAVIYIHAIAIKLRLLLHGEDEAFYGLTSSLAKVGRYKKDGETYDISGRKVKDRTRGLPPAPEGWSVWGRKVPKGPALELQTEDERSHDGRYAWHPGYYDATDAHGTGGTWIRSPGPMASFLSANYAGRALTIGSVSTFGTIKYFERILRGWARRHKPLADSYDLYWRTTESRPVSSLIAELFSECPGLPRLSVGAAGTDTIIAMSGEGLTGQDTLYGRHASTATGLSVASGDILRDEENGLALEVMWSPATEIVNELEIHYQYDIVTGKYGRVAKADWGTSDDGYGNIWPYDPWNTNAADAICTLSRNVYTQGEPSKLTLHLKYHWQPETAVGLGCWYLWRQWRPYATIRFHGGLSCQDILPGQVISFSDDLLTIGGMVNPIPWRSSNRWEGFWWHVLAVTRRFDPPPNGIGVYYEIVATEHLANGGTPGALTGGPVIAGEGFDGVA